MYCTNCGQNIGDDASKCPSCGKSLLGPSALSEIQPQQGSSLPVSPIQEWETKQQKTANAEIPSNLVWAILSTLFCSLPIGIVSIVFASKVEGLKAKGEYEAARIASNRAKNWAIASAITSLALGVILVILIRLGVVPSDLKF